MKKTPPPRLAHFRIEGVRAVVVELALGAVRHGSLTPTERDVAALAMRGMTDREIAAKRGTSVRTVAHQMASILRKTGASSRSALAAVLPGDA